MKQKLLLLLVLSISFSLQSCVDFVDNSIIGTGNVVSEIRNVGDFNGIHAASGLKVYVEFGEMSDEVEILADENLHEYIITEVRNGILTIKSRRNIRRADSKEVYVKAGKIEFLETSSAARLIGNSVLSTNDLRINVSSAGRLEVEMDADDIDVEVSSSGNAVLSGFASSMEADVSSAGDLSARMLKVVDCYIDVSSAGDASVNVSGEFSADASSAGRIIYEGDPQLKKLDQSSAGKISKRK